MKLSSRIFLWFICFSTSVVMTPAYIQAHNSIHLWGVPPTPTISAGGPVTFCQGGSVILTATSTGATTYQWYLNGGQISGATTQTYTVSATGNYTVTATNTSGTSAASTATVVTVNPNPSTPTVTAQGSTSFCAGQSVQLKANASGATAYQWSMNGNPVTDSTAQTFTASAAGSYSVTVSNSNGCVSPSSATTTVTTVPAPAAPTISASGPTTFCTGGSVILTANASGAASYQWFLNGTSISGATTNTYTTNTSGNYTVVITNSSGCMSAASAPTTVTVNPPPPAATISASGPTTFCTGGSVILTANAAGATAYQWFLNGSAITGATTQTYTAAASGSYTVSIVNASACTSPLSAATIVSINPTPATPTITAGGNTPICQGGTVTLTANASGATAYQWSLGGSAITGATASTYGASVSGSYTVAITDGNGCTSASSSGTTVTIVPDPAAPTISSSGSTTICSGASTTLTATGTGATAYQWFLNGSAISGATFNTYPANTAGNYTATITNSTGCTSAPSAPATVTVDPPPTAPTVSSAGSTSFCAPGSVVLTANATGASSYQWFFDGNPISGATSQNYTATATGNYTVTVTNSGGCSSIASASTTVTAYTALTSPTVNVGGPTTFCSGGGVLLSVSSADASTFQWYVNGAAIIGATSPTYVATASGSYTIIISNPCSAPATSSPITVTVNPAPTAPSLSAGGPLTFCAPNSVVLTATPAGSFAYQWFNNGISITGATSQTYTATASGSYTVTAINSLGCSSQPSVAQVVTVYPPLTSPTISAGGPTTFCSGNNVLLTVGFTGVTQFQWYLNGAAIPGATTSQYTATASGSYTVNISNPCSAANSSPITVTVNPAPTVPTVSAGGPTTFCSGSSVLLTANASGISSFQWYVDGNPISGATGQTYTATVSGSYTVIVANTGGCTATSAATPVTVYPPLAALSISISAGGPTTFCQGGNVVLTANASGATTYQWIFDGTPITGANSQTYTATVSGSYTVSISNPCSTVTSAAAVVTVNPVPTTPTITADGNTDLCAGDTVILAANASGATSYQWFLGGTFISGAINSLDTATIAGSYTVSVTNASGCTSAASAPTVVTINPLPAAPTLAAAGPTTFCQGSSVVLNATPSGAGSYQWFLGSASLINTTSSSYAGNLSGNYTVTLTDANGCVSPSSAPVSVTVNPAPAVPTISPAGVTTECAGDSVILTATSTGTNTYQWLMNGAPIAAETTLEDTVSTSGSYTISVTNTNGCTTTSANTTVTINPTPVTPIANVSGPTTFCAGDSVILTANSSGAASYQWFFNGTVIAGETTSMDTAKATGNYTVSITDANGCVSAVSLTTSVTVNPVPVTPDITTPGSLGVCPGQTLTLSAIPTGATAYQWYFNGTAVTDSTNQTYTTGTAGSYTVTSSNSFGCLSTPSLAAVVSNPCLPKADLALVKTVSPGPYNVQKPITYLLTLTNNGPDTALNIVITDTLPQGLSEPSNYGGNGPAPTYDATTGVLTWTLPELDSGTNVSVSFDVSIKSFGTIANTGTVTSIVLDPDTTNNHSTAVFTIAGDLFIPNLVTPNGDGKNDYFVILGLSRYPGSSLRVYNRWGSEVYQSQNYNNDWGGSGLNDGTYFYVLIVNTPTGKQAYKGWVELLH